MKGLYEKDIVGLIPICRHAQGTELYSGGLERCVQCNDVIKFDAERSWSDILYGRKKQ